MKSASYTLLAAVFIFSMSSCVTPEKKTSPPMPPAQPATSAPAPVQPVAMPVSKELEGIRKLLDSSNPGRDYLKALKDLKEYLKKSKDAQADLNLVDTKDLLAILDELKAATDSTETEKKKNAELASEINLLRVQIKKLQALDIEMEKKRNTFR